MIVRCTVVPASDMRRCSVRGEVCIAAAQVANVQQRSGELTISARSTSTVGDTGGVGEARQRNVHRHGPANRRNPSTDGSGHTDTTTPSLPNIDAARSSTPIRNTMPTDDPHTNTESAGCGTSPVSAP